MRPKVVYKTEDLKTILQRKSIITDTLIYIMRDLNTLPDKFNMIGIANNTLLGVFGIEYNDDGYFCYRIYYQNNEFIIADIGYPISNMDTEANLECEMDYVITKRLLYKESMNLLIGS